jgi:RNA polymerase subunit RPABC4/transcription elongation factor Spt4
MTDLVAHVFDNPIFPAIGLALAATAGALWLAGSWWAYHDAAWRTGSTFVGLVAAGWIAISSPLLLPLSLGVYALVRPQHTAAQGRSRRLVEELVDQLDAEETTSCPACAAVVETDWLRCPACATWLATPCSSCGAWSERSLEICPWCGNEERDEPSVEERKPAAAIGASRKPRRRQSRRQPAGVVAFDSRPTRGRLEALLDARPPARAGSR